VSDRVLQIPTSPVFLPLLRPARYKGAYGGRGSGKSEFFAGYVIEECLLEPGTRAVCIREVQKTLRDSSHQTLSTVIQRHGLGAYFDIQEARIITPGGGAIIFTGMNDQSAESIKSLAQNRLAWVDEAQMLSERSLAMLDPTLRWERKENGKVVKESELLFSWNPTRKSDPVDKMFRLSKSPDMICVKANWMDNEFFPQSLHKARLKELAENPDRYPHTWDGEYARAFEGAYFAVLLSDLQKDGRVCALKADPVLPIRAYFDIGGSGARADAMAIWIVQFVAQSVYVLDYIEGIGQPIGYYAMMMRDRGWEHAEITLPHDGLHHNNLTGKRYLDHWEEAGFRVNAIENQGAGAAAARIEAVRRLLPRCWFDKDKTEAGRDALGFYHEKMDSVRGIGLGPEHDWSSHAADAFGLMAISYEDPARMQAFGRDIKYPQLGIV
jgi:phage terminase large subunit